MSGGGHGVKEDFFFVNLRPERGDHVLIPMGMSQCKVEG